MAPTGSADGDGDGLWDYNEVTDFMTNRNDSDTDDDEYLDGVEINEGHDSLDPASSGLMN